MNILEEQLQKIKQQKRIGLMTHVVVGYPSLQETVNIVKTMVDAGIDIVELQIPFSDPLADGPTIMKACENSLENGTKVKDAFKIMKQLSSEVSIPLLFMAYYNTVFRYGVEQFCCDAKAAGATGLIVPDMPIDEESEEHFFAYCKKYDLYHIQVISPASTDERLRKNAQIANGFVYFTARQGTTGVKQELDTQLSKHLQKINKLFAVPIAVGFGISQKEHVQALQGKADIAIVGSAIIDIITQSDKGSGLQHITNFISKLKMVK